MINEDGSEKYILAAVKKNASACHSSSISRRVCIAMSNKRDAFLNP